MMDFLRGLAPRRDGDASWAVPVVPSRFSESRPLLLAAPPPVHTPGLDTEVAQPLPPVMRARTAPPTSRPAHDSAVTEAPAPTAAIALQAARPERAQDLDVRPIVLRQPPARVITAPLVEHASASEISRRDTEPPPAARAATPLVLARVTARLAGTPAVERTDAAATVSAPLSAAALAERPAPAAAPPVIHVTIDRIEVRAPAASRPAAAPARSRAHAASVSLTDYLRRSRNPGGAP
jgi:hypothetical protein